MFFYCLCLILLLTEPLYSLENQQKPKVLHLTFHRGCEKEFSAVAQELSLDLETWFIPDLPSMFLDGVTTGNALYNMGHCRAENIWDLHQDYFDTFDLIVVSDTAPLSRIFLQNGWKKPLVIWVCNRFDYVDMASLDCDFPDSEYYQLFKQACSQSNVKVIGYTEFEHYYARTKGIETGGLTIAPCAAYQFSPQTHTSIPSSIHKEETFYLPPYLNESEFMNLSSFCGDLGIKCYRGRYGSPMDLVDFKGIIHLPYSWSNLAFFENIGLGIVYFVPSPTFFRKLADQGGYFHPSISSLINENLFHLSEWYCDEHSDIIVYFDSWKDLKEKTISTDFSEMREKIKNYALVHKAKMFSRWKAVFENLFDENL
jgi:hypothetical protein